jgi:hypothetical protein
MTSQNEKLLQAENAEGRARRFGFEVEYAGLSLKDAAQIITALYGGKVEPEHTARIHVKETQLGDFVLELDAIPLQKMAEESHKLKASERLGDRLQRQLSETIEGVGAKITPYEIICPPITSAQIGKLEKLCQKLREAGAKGTRGGVHYAFGLHINAEVTSLETKDILNQIRSFLLLAPWLVKAHEINISRRVTRFIDPFPGSYLALVLDEAYKPDITTLIKDYHRHNPTRNRALDMLPLFAHIKPALVEELYGKEEKINPRPTHHYRLPNSEIGQADWTIMQELERWLMVEKVAADKALLGKLMEAWQVHQQQFLSRSAKWVQTVNGLLRDYQND